MSLSPILQHRLNERVMQRPLEYSGYIEGIYRLGCDLKPRIVVELGTWVGNSAFAWMAAMDTYKQDQPELWSIDINTDNIDPLILDVKHFDWDDRFRGIQADSVEYAQKWESQNIDLLYIDTDHSYERTLAELDAWIPKIKENGRVVLDDSLAYPEVQQAFDYYMKGHRRIREGQYLDGPPYTVGSHGMIIGKLGA